MKNNNKITPCSERCFGKSLLSLSALAVVLLAAGPALATSGGLDTPEGQKELLLAVEGNAGVSVIIPGASSPSFSGSSYTPNVLIPGKLGVGLGASGVPTSSLQVGGDAIVAGKVGVGTGSPKSALDVNGEVRAGNSNAACTAANVGAVRYDASKDSMMYCNASTLAWKEIGSSSSGVDHSNCVYVSFPTMRGGVVYYCPTGMAMTAFNSGVVNTGTKTFGGGFLCCAIK